MEYLGYRPFPERSGIPSLGTLVRLHRIHRGLSLRQAAHEIGCDPVALSAWEKGDAAMTLATLYNLARIGDKARGTLVLDEVG